MGAVTPRVARALDMYVPPRPAPDGWSSIVSATDAGRRRRRWAPRAAVAFAGALAATLALVLAWPSNGPSGGVLQRALAAAGDGPVLHVVFREGWGGTLVDLRTGDRRRLFGEREVWYDPQRGIHTVSRLGGQPGGEALYPPGRVRFEDKTFAVLATGYREALESGKARLLGPGELDGIPVYWIRVDAEWHEDVADGKQHELAHDVAVSRDSYEPVGTRETLDGKDSPDGPARIVEFETLAEGAGDFTAKPDALDGTAVMCCGPGDPIALREAPDVLGATPLWLGQAFDGLPLARVARSVVGVRPPGASDWQRTTTLDVFYGQLDGDRPDFTKPNVRLQEMLRLEPAFPRGGYVPAPGQAFLSGGSALANVDGVFVSVDAATGSDSGETALEAARALEPLP